MSGVSLLGVRILQWTMIKYIHKTTEYDYHSVNITAMIIAFRLTLHVIGTINNQQPTHA